MSWKKLTFDKLKIDISYSSGTEAFQEEEIFLQQDRVEKAFDLALKLEKDGYNVYVCGPNGIGRTTYTLNRLKKIAQTKETPSDICYVTNFKDSYKPKALILPAGYGKKLAEHIENILEFLKRETHKAFEGKEYEDELSTLGKEIDSQKEKIINEMTEEAKKYNLMVLFGPEGVRLLPMFKIETSVPQEELLANPQIREEYQKNLQAFEPKFREYMRKLRELDSSFGENLIKLRKRIAEKLVNKAFQSLEEDFKNVMENLKDYISSLKKELIKNINIFIDWEKAKGNIMLQTSINKALNVFRVNVLVDNSEIQGAPVIYEKSPTLKGLFGQINYKAEMGILYADHLSLTPGILHKANGGYLVLDLWEILKNPYIWILLKRTLLTKKLYIMGGMVEEIPVPHVGILPESIPFSAKVFLIGDTYLYHLLTTYDHEFKELFKIKAEFNPVVDLNDEIIQAFPKIIKNIIKKENLKELDASGLSELLKYAIYQAENKKKIALILQDIIDLLREANTISQNEQITEKDIKQAQKEKILRVNLIEEKIRELIKEGKIIIDVEGKKVGQINGLSVYILGDYNFGKPSRITANVFPGSRGVVNIEREIDMSGPIHSKGVLIFSSYFYNKYSSTFPIQFSCTLTFEQAYEPVEGDSASAAELMVILSAVSKIPIRQDIAITGSIDQFGNIQPVGGIKEKIEGFYRSCKMTKFTGNQGVIVPAKNFDNILLEDDVLEDIKAGNFHIYTVETIDDVIEILTGYKPEKFHKEVSKGLKKLYELSKEKGKKEETKRKKKTSKKKS
ncbi:Lon protease family protein [Thermodesulfobacterium hydrogeniphilum]|uniref:Lon protease family protein n=1 Tax=Thermodesulfobacterium hydrogeniphilum TaxID=161156 RepID=UPI0005710A20|nr:ATP-binding protein [Thermodesulfobacterium hydrogeniphilum]